MMYTIRVSDGVDKVIAKWKKSNPNLFKKYKKIYKELLEHPKTGLGHPEALRGGTEYKASEIGKDYTLAHIEKTQKKMKYNSISRNYGNTLKPKNGGLHL